MSATVDFVALTFWKVQQTKQNVHRRSLKVHFSCVLFQLDCISWCKAKITWRFEVRTLTLMSFVSGSPTFPPAPAAAAPACNVERTTIKATNMRKKWENHPKTSKNTRFRSNSMGSKWRLSSFEMEAELMPNTSLCSLLDSRRRLFMPAHQSAPHTALTSEIKACK